MDFVHLHVHTPYSLLDGAAKIGNISKRVSQMGQTSVAITDHGVLHGVHEFYKEMKEHNIKPIIGMEGYIVADHLAKNKQERAAHILLLAQDYGGYQNISRLSTISHQNGFYRKPRIDMDLLRQYSEGIIVTSGCLAADIPQAIMAGDEESALALIEQYREIFGDRFYLEVQPRDNREGEQWIVNDWLLSKSADLGLKVVATTDAHYVVRSDAGVHDALLCVQTGAKLDDENRMRFDENTYYLQSGDEVLSYFPDRPDVLSNTLEVAERTNIEFPKSGYHLPDFHVPGGYSQDSYLRELVYIGACWRYGGDSETHDVKSRIEYELETIKKMGFSPYFLTVWDICTYAHKNNIWWNVRGSAAGSVVAYCLGITTIDPLENNLYFERFLNPERISMPDIDIDFEDSRRGVMAHYLSLRYGEDHVAQIMTFGYIKAKNAIKDFARVSGYPVAKANEMTKFLDTYLDGDKGLEDIEFDPDVIDWLNKESDRIEVFDGAKKLQGFVRNTGVHAAGIVVSDAPISEYVPLARNKDDEGFGITQFDDEQVEKLGLLKIDFLGLTTLTVLREACALIKQRHGEDLSPANIPYLGHKDDSPGLDKAYDMIARGHTAGVFQLESQGMTGVIRKMRPNNFEDISAAIALYRPGPLKFIDTYIERKNGRSPISYRHDKLRPILEPTMGIPIYQESLMEISKELFGYTGAQADHLRKDMAKKTGKMGEHHARFLENGQKNGLSVEVINQIWSDIEGFAAYAFNKSHSADYAKISVQSAWVKANYQIEYMVSLMNSYSDNPDRLGKFIAECRSLGIELCPPDINRSGYGFTILDNKIVFGLTCIKNVGQAMVEPIVAARGETPFKSFDDLLSRVDFSSINSRALDSMIKVGCFDSFGTREQFLRAVEPIRKSMKKINKSRAKEGQATLFSIEEQIKERFIEDFVDYSDPEFKLDGTNESWEIDLLGAAISSFDVEETNFFDGKNLYPLDVLSEALGINMPVTVGGRIEKVKEITDKNNKKMAFVDISDHETGTVKVGLTFFSSAWKKYTEAVNASKFIVVSGKADSSRGEVSVLVDKVVSHR